MRVLGLFLGVFEAKFSRKTDELKSSCYTSKTGL